MLLYGICGCVGPGMWVKSVLVRSVLFLVSCFLVVFGGSECLVGASCFANLVVCVFVLCG
jgi:hypothetical protein